MIAPARLAALAVLRDVNADRLDLPAALAQVRPTLHDDRDRALATDLATGTLRWQGELDHLISHFAKRPVGKLDFDVLQILRLGAYQLLHLDRVPAAAAVNDAVSMTKRAKKASAAGLVNAVLRGLSRNRHRLPLPPASDPLPFLEISLSHPRWLARRWLDRYGFAAAETWERFNNAPAPMTLRVNTLKTSMERLSAALAQHGVDAAPARFAPDGLVVSAGNPLRTPLARTGDFFVQDEASQLVSLLADPAPGTRILDACASPGGKTTAMAAMTGDAADIVATDVRTARMSLLRETVKSSGSRRIRLLQADLEAGLPFGSSFDVVFVDAPCSGLGVIRRDPEIRWRRRESDLPRLAAAQLAMLRNAAATVRQDGRLIYSTCSSEPDECDAVVEAFLKEDRRFRRIDLNVDRPTQFAALEPVLDEDGFLRTRPDIHGLEAFFGASMRRVE
jgi:16S rRNA (cytosine967-C5)-methyltransferase